MSNYIRLPHWHDCVWFKGPPPAIGWWPASVARRAFVLRYWDGKHWSQSVHMDTTRQEIAQIKLHQALGEEKHIRWINRWWLK